MRSPLAVVVILAVLIGVMAWLDRIDRRIDR